ncbi:MAG: DM13 domain-containing protein [Halobacteriales archaeon]|nr:DM13 domain-containing protein [Halobacteriales archaeon]
MQRPSLPNSRSRWLLAGVVVMVLLGGGYLVADMYFLPEQSTVVDEAVTPSGTETVLATGMFTGTTGHRVSGTVRLVEDADGYALHFEEYAQTQGPDVFVYVTPAATPDSRAEIAAGQKVLIDGGADGGESTKEGTFVQRLPADVDSSQLGGVAIWCDQFGVPFGYATLEPAG